MARVLHLLPHPGGGAETYVDLLTGMEGFEHARVPLSLRRTPRGGAVSIPARWPAIARRAAGADLLHAHGDVSAVLALAHVRPSRPGGWTTHGLHFLRAAAGSRHATAVRAVRAAIARTSFTLCTSLAEREELAQIAGPALSDRLLHVPNGIPEAPPVRDAQRDATRAELGLDPADVAVLFLGELEPRKAPLDAVAATVAARDRGAPVVLLLAGDGSQLPIVRARAGAGVRPLGHRHDVERLLGAADAFVLPSEREGLAFAALEAMAHGLAMVVSDGPGNPEAVGDAGIVVPAGDRRALADALERLAADPAERDRLGAAARRRAREEFPVDRLRDGVAQAYRRALAQRVTAPARGAGAERA